MANLPEQAIFEDGIYQLETDDPVVGGANGVSNAQAKQLANRTTWLKQEADEVINARGGKVDLDTRFDDIESALGLAGAGLAAPIRAQQSGGAVLGGRNKLNFIPGANVVVTVADDAANNRINVTIAQSGSSSPIRSIQRGTVLIGPTNGQVDITIAAVDVSKSMILPPTIFDSYAHGTLTVDFLNATTLRFTATNSNYPYPIGWEVVEFI